ncbi:MAG: metallophosphoesterase [Pyrinomonadaceae bacterium MAG19_C2-C3]|nr:metallophosphoesterase [Pyrinomonadaceae bacterium MAG19_C2-C3]
MIKRTIIVGDIHGCYVELNDLFELIQLTANDRVIAVGDLIVKGTDSAAVLNRFIEDERFSSVIGNHDLGVLNHWRGHGKVKRQQAACAEELSGDKARFETYLAALPKLIELENHIIVHAGLRPRVELQNQSLQDCTELRTLGEDHTSREGLAWYEVYRGVKPVVFGHWAGTQVRRPQLKPECATGIDTGCVYGNRLTAYILESGELPSVPARAMYEKPKKPIDNDAH